MSNSHTWANAPINSVQILSYHYYNQLTQIPTIVNVNDTKNLASANITFNWNNDGSFTFNLISTTTYTPLTNINDVNTFVASPQFSTISRLMNRTTAFNQTNVELRRLLFAIYSLIVDPNGTHNYTDTQLIALITPLLDSRLNNNLSE